MQKVIIVLLSVTLCWRLTPIHAQYSPEIPSIPCPQLFEYLSYDGTYIGKLTLPNLSMGQTVVDVQFSQRRQLNTGYFGSLSLFQDQDTTIELLKRGDPISYRVDFPLPNVIPMLTQVSVNGRVICSGSDYQGPSTSLSLQHTLRTSVSMVRGNRPINNNILGPNISYEPTNFTGLRPIQSFDRYDETPTILTRPPQTQFQPQQPTFSANIPFSPVQSARTPPPTPAPTAAPTRASASNSQDLATICGTEGSISRFSPFIHGGTVLNRGQHPWLTAIYQKDPTGLKFLCGGSLISSRTIITAAHCFQLTQLTAESVLVYLGRYNLTNFMERFVELRDIQTLLINPEYNPTTYPDADVALLQMATPVSFTEYIRPICLWSETSEHSFVAGMAATVAGWGGDEVGNAVSQVPKFVQANIVTGDTCLRSLPVFTVLTSPRTLCAGDRDGSGPCMGDSGGGLMLNRNGRWMLRGIVSAGQTEQRRCNLREYVIYCDIAKHMTWISSSMLT